MKQLEFRITIGTKNGKNRYHNKNSFKYKEVPVLFKKDEFIDINEIKYQREFLIIFIELVINKNFI